MSSRPPKSKSRKSGDSAAKLARLSEPLQECANILKFFQSRPDADAFTEPVDWEAFGLLDYPEVRTKGEQKRETRENNERIGDACSARMLIAAALVSLCVSVSLALAADHHASDGSRHRADEVGRWQVQFPR
jgi:hypothetical protein